VPSQFIIDPVELDNAFSQGAVGGPTYSTTVTTPSTGYDYANQNWDTARMQWEIGHTISNVTMMQTLLAFFRARKGQFRGFLFRDWSDFYVGMTFINDVLTQTSSLQFATGDGTTTAFQLTKTYPDSYNPEVRKITRPISGTLSIFVAASLQTEGADFTVNYTTGVVTFAHAPANTDAISWAGQFNVPVRFNSDVMSMNLKWLSRGEWQSITVIEVKE
jgi:uncharacterized protein (TIGR02217 family)